MLIGLTGGIASGKSTVSRMMRELGLPVIDADQVARKVVEPGQPAWKEIKEQFGEEVLLPDGSLNRKKLAEIIFHDEEKRQLLNRITHPHIRREMDRQTEEALKKHKVVVLDIPLLFEGGRADEMDKVLVVYVPEDVQVRRLMERDEISEEYARQKIASQMPLEEKKKRADAYIDNSKSLDETRRQLLSILKRWGIDLSHANAPTL